MTITKGPRAKTTDTTPMFAFTSDDLRAAITCSVDGRPVSPCASGTTLKKLKPGKHLFRVTATDASGNAGSAQQSFTVKKRKKR